MVDNDIHYIRKEVDNIQSRMAQFSVRTEYAQTDSDTTAPTTGWGDEKPEPQEGYFVWARNIMNFGYGDVKTEAYCIGDGLEHILSIDVEYIAHSDAYSPPSQDSPYWQTTAPSLQEGQYIWSRTKIVSTYGTTYTSPVRVTGLQGERGHDGIDGKAGKDGKGIEFIFKRVSAKVDNWNNPPTGVTNPATLPAQPTIDDYVPSGWTDDQVEVTMELPFQYVSTRTKSVATGETAGEWGTFNTPKLWSVYGEKPYCHIRYSDVNNPQEWSQTYANPQSSGSGEINYHKYEGYLWNEEETLSDANKDPTLFTWRIYRPTIGIAGEEGSFLHIQFADDEAGTNMNQYEGDYMGTCVTWEEEDPNDPDLYHWVRIRGNAGVSTEFVYYTTDVANYSSLPSNIQNTPALKKWCERPFAVSEANPYCYVSVKDSDSNTWTVPVLWAKYGEKGSTGSAGERGEDGAGLELIFRRNNSTTTAPTFTNGQNLASFTGKVNNKSYQDDDFVPQNWTDDQQGVDSSNSVEWVSMRFKRVPANGKEATWGDFNTPKVWATWSEDGRGVVSIVEEYASHTSYSNPPTTGWSTTRPAYEVGKFYWTRSVITYDTGDPTTTTPICVSGLDGSDVHYVYYCCNSLSTPSTPTWNDIHTNSSTMSQNYNKWVEDPVPVTESNKYIYISVANSEYNSQGVKGWSTFSLPALWSRYADDGINGLGYEYAYYTSEFSTVPEKPTGNVTATSGREKWTKVPIAMTSKYKYMYITYRTKQGSTTSDWSNTALWSQFGDKGDAGAKGIDGKGLEHIFYRSNSEINWASNDNLYNDKATSNTTSRYYLSNCTLSFDTNKLVMTRTSTDGCYLDYRISDPATLLAKYLDKTIRFECDIESATAECYIRIGQIVDGEASYSSTSTRVTNGHLSIDYTIDANATTVMFRLFGALLDVGGTCSFRNFKISSFTNPTKWSTTGDFQNDDYVKPNSGWSDDAQGVDKNHIYEYCAIRTKTPNANGVGVWGAFNPPILWAVYTSPIGDVINYYLATSSGSGVTTSTSGWKTTVQSMTATNQYLWNYEVIKAVDGTTLNTTDPVIIGRWGQNGSNGRGISAVTEHYAVNNSTTAPSSGWVSPPWTSSNPIPTTSESNRYLWNYETLTYVDGTPATEDTAKRIISVHGQRGSDGITPDTSTIVDEVGDAIQRKDIVLNDVDAITLEGKSADAFMSVTPLLATIQQEGVGSGIVECRKFGQLVVVNINQCTVNNTSSSQTGWEAMRKTNSSWLVIPSEYQPSTDMIVGAGTNSANSNDAQLRIINASHDTNAGKIFFKRSGYISATNYGEIVSATFVYFRDSRTATNITATNSANTMYPADSITFTLKSGNTALANKTINIRVNDVNYPKTTDANGKATIKLNLPAKLSGDAYDYHNYNYTVRFNGDETYAPSSTSGTVRLNYAPAQITHTLPSTNDGQKIIIGRNTPFTGAVKNPNGQGIRGIEVTVSIIGKTFKGKTDNDGNFNIYHPNDGQTYDNPNSSTTTDYIVNANLFTKKNQLRIDPYPNYYGN